MRLLTDENISWRLKKLLPDWDIIPVNEIESSYRISDISIWQFAKENKLSILTFDEDFSELQNLYSFPPKVIWMRIGNMTAVGIANILLKYQTAIENFIVDAEIGIYEIHF